MHHTDRVTVAPCDLRGRVKGPTVEAIARVLPASDGPRIERLLNRRYGLTKRLYSMAMGLWQRLIVRQPPDLAAYIEISVREE